MIGGMGTHWGIKVGIAVLAIATLIVIVLALQLPASINQLTLK